MIECQGLAKRYDDQLVVEEIDLLMEQGELLVLIGA